MNENDVVNINNNNKNNNNNDNNDNNNNGNKRVFSSSSPFFSMWLSLSHSKKFGGQTSNASPPLCHPSLQLPPLITHHQYHPTSSLLVTSNLIPSISAVKNRRFLGFEKNASQTGG